MKAVKENCNPEEPKNNVFLWVFKGNLNFFLSFWAAKICVRNKKIKFEKKHQISRKKKKQPPF